MYRQGVKAAAVSRAGNVWSFAMKKACPDLAVDACALCCDCRGVQPCTQLPDGQFPHARHARIARRANLSQVSALATSGKSKPSSRASRLDEEGRFGRSSRYVGRGCGGRGWHVRRTWRMRTAKSCGSGAPKQALRSRDLSCERRWQPSKGHRGERDISRKTIAQGMPVDLALPVVTAACFSCCRRAMGEVVTRHSLRPL